MKNIDESKRKELTQGIIFMNDTTWFDYINEDRITILHFLSSVDLVSRQQIPMIREFAAKYGDMYTIGVLDAGLCPSACRSCEIKGLPTMVVLRKGMVLASYRGKQNKQEEPELVLQLNTWQKMDIDKFMASKGIGSPEKVSCEGRELQDSITV